MNRNELKVGNRVGYQPHDGSRWRMGTILSLTAPVRRLVDGRYRDFESGIQILLEEPYCGSTDLVLKTAAKLEQGHIADQLNVGRDEQARQWKAEREWGERLNAELRQAFGSMDVSIEARRWGTTIHLGSKEAFAKFVALVDDDRFTNVVNANPENAK